MTDPKPSRWTGGQYSLFRAILGAYLLVHFAQLVPWGVELFSNAGVLPDANASPLCWLPNVLAHADAPWQVTTLLVAGSLASLALAIGYRDRLAAAFLLYLWACLFGRNPLIQNPSIPYVGWLLAMHMLLPSAPYGSFAARGRTDPAGTWQMAQSVHRVAWIVMAVGYTYSGITKLTSPSWLDGSALRMVLENPLARPGVIRDTILELHPALLAIATWGALALEVLFAPLALSRRLRPWLWGGMLSMHLGLIVLLDFADLSLGMVVLHLFTFDPGWVRPKRHEGRVRVFFDGACGLCHGFVRFLLAEDPRSNDTVLSPLQGETARRELAHVGPLPDSIVVRPADGRVLTKSSAVAFLLERMGGAWRVLGTGLCWIPRPVRDAGYDVVARLRRRFGATPTDVCPVVPAGLRERLAP